MKIIFTLQDHPDSRLTVDMDIDPPIDPEAEATGAFLVANAMVEAMTAKLQEIGAGSQPPHSEN